MHPNGAYIIYYIMSPARSRVAACNQIHDCVKNLDVSQLFDSLTIRRDTVTSMFYTFLLTKDILGGRGRGVYLLQLCLDSHLFICIYL